MNIISDEIIMQYGHRMASKYRHSWGGNSGHHYEFQPHTLIQFAHAVAEAAIAADRERCWMKLAKPAKVGAATFGVGVSERMVIEAAQRQYEYSLNPEPEKIGAIKRLLDTDREQRKPAAPSQEQKQ